MFGYSCECGRGTVREQVFRNYRRRFRGVWMVVPEARIGVCDVCGERCYSAKELKKWERTARKE